MLALALLAGVLAPWNSPCARAQVPPAGTSPQPLPSWWGAPGSAGWTPDAALTSGAPWTFAGLMLGGWDLRDPIAPATMPGPGIPEAQVPLAWLDAATVRLGEDAAWDGFGTGLAVARGTLKPASSRQPRAVVTVQNGAHGLDRNGLYLSRGDARSWLRAGALAGSRGAIGDLDVQGVHLWTVESGIRRGAHVLEASFAQRGAGESELAANGESVRGESGMARWAWSHGRDSLQARFTRGWDTRYVFPSSGGSGETYRRDAQANRFELEALRRGAERDWGLHASVREARVVGILADPFGVRISRDEWSERDAWVSGRMSQPWNAGRLELQLGAGGDRATRRSWYAPGLSWTTVQGTGRVRVFAERAITPVWSDPAPGQAAFAQDAWVGGFEAGRGADSTAHGSVTLLAGRTEGRAVLYRYPLLGVSLFNGYLRDLEPWRFLLLQGACAGRWRALDGDASAFAVARPRASSRPRVDPALGARVGGGLRFRMFAGDLATRLRVEGAYVGSRETDSGTILVADETLPGYFTMAASATFGFGDATLVVRGEGLENARHPLPWSDPSDTRLARDAGRQVRFEVVWPLFN